MKKQQRVEPIQTEAVAAPPHPPELKLIIATVKQAVQDVRHANPEIHDPAWAWFKSSSEEPFSFLWCCDVVNMAPDVILKRITH